MSVDNEGVISLSENAACYRIIVLLAVGVSSLFFFFFLQPYEAWWSYA